MSFFENMAIISIGEIKVSHKNTAYVALRNFIQSNANLTNLHFFSFFLCDSFCREQIIFRYEASKR